METIVEIENLKCGGCASTITKEISAIAGVEHVKVDNETNKVSLTHDGLLNMELVKERLAALGYPEKGSVEGIKKITANAKSYVSCAIGRLSD
jgi:copper chaperone